MRGSQDRVMVLGAVWVQYHLVLMPPLPFARCVCLPVSNSTHWNLSPTSGQYTTLLDCGCGNELSRRNMACVIETLAAVHVCTQSHHSPTQHLLSNHCGTGHPQGGLSLVRMSL